MFKRLFMLVLVLAILAASAQYWLPSAIAVQISQAINRKVESEKISVDIKDSSIMQLFNGKIGKVNIAAQNAKLDKLVIKELNATLQDVEFDMSTVFAGKLEPQNIRNAAVKLSITEEELSRYLSNNVKGVKNAVVTVKPELVKINCDFSVAGLLTVTVVLEGKIVADKQKIKFVTERFSLNNTAVGNVSGSKLSQIPIADIENLPFGVLVRSIKQDDGKVIVEADNQR